MMVKPDRVDKDVYRLVYGETIVAFSLRLSNGRWCVADHDWQRTGAASYDSPAKAAASVIPAAAAST